MNPHLVYWVGGYFELIKRSKQFFLTLKQGPQKILPSPSPAIGILPKLRANDLKCYFNNKNIRPKISLRVKLFEGRLGIFLLLK
ncbi:hypothetical protein AOY38_03225 [Synechocystis sp. PCC 6803]|nr:hypothetical protein AOY38_03225 [Synechocystis sp. PCC 6803]